MRALSFSILRPAFLLIGAIVINGCAPLVSRPPTPIISEQARQALQQISEQNASLTSFKGLGQIAINSEKQPLKSRLAWMGEVPDKLRLEILDPTGRPILAMSTDGRDFFLLEHGGEGRFMKRDARRVPLERIIGIPIPIEDIIHLLAGRIPLRPYDTAELSPTDTNPTQLVLGRNQGDPVEIIYLHPETGLPAGIEFYDGARSRPQYRVGLIGVTTSDGFDIPETIVLEGRDGTAVTIAIDRYWANAAVSPEQFVLTPPPDPGRLP